MTNYQQQQNLYIDTNSRSPTAPVDDVRGRRLAALRRAMVAASLDALLVTSPANLAYITGHTLISWERFTAALVLPDQPPRLIVPALDRSLFDREESGLDLLTWEDSVGFETTLAVAGRDLSHRSRLGVEEQHVSKYTYRRLVESFPSHRLVDASALVASARMVKDPNEIELLRSAARIADAVMEVVIAEELRPGKTEAEIAATCIRLGFDAGADDIAFFPTVLSGCRAIAPHSHSSHARLVLGEPIIIDFGFSVSGYCSDITRTVVLGNASDQQRHLFSVVNEAQEAAIRAIGPGRSAGDVDAAARAVFEAAGLKQSVIHRTGHGIGLEPHESPSLSLGQSDPLVIGMVVTVEPGVYWPSLGSARIEDVILVTGGEPEFLTSAPRALEISV